MDHMRKIYFPLKYPLVTVYPPIFSEFFISTTFLAEMVQDRPGIVDLFHVLRLCLSVEVPGHYGGLSCVSHNETKFGFGLAEVVLVGEGHLRSPYVSTG
jgi:hypothetical protein